jgi:transcription elongation GreA/GreB family factor
MTQSERERLEALLKKLKEKERPDISIRAQIHSIEELLNAKR